MVIPLIQAVWKELRYPSQRRPEHEYHPPPSTCLCGMKFTKANPQAESGRCALCEDDRAHGMISDVIAASGYDVRTGPMIQPEVGERRYKHPYFRDRYKHATL